MIIERILQLAELIDKKTHFLFGPRQTGKTTLIREQLPNLRTFNLLESDTFAELSARPSLLREIVQPGERIVIDEIQKLPVLLDEVHLLIEERKACFLLTGSSARKLKRGGSNLLGGRARSRQLLPLCSAELKDSLHLEECLNRGLLPSIYFSDDPNEDLKAYVGDYLSQEIAAEAIVRNIPAFSRFLRVAAQFNAKQVNFEKLASDAQVSPSTVRNYFQILRDTLIGSTLPPWPKKKQSREVSTPKFYLFDTGVARQLQGRKSYPLATPEFGDALEAFIHHELKSYIEYRRPETELSFWRTYEGHEVDFIVNSEIALEVKASNVVVQSDIKGLLAISENYPIKRRIVICQEKHERNFGENRVEVLPWKLFLELLWNGELF